MLKILIKKQLREIFRSYFVDQKKHVAKTRKGTIVSFLVFFVLMIGMFGGMFGALGVSLCGAFMSADVSWLYFTVFGIVSIALGVFGSVFNTYSVLYLAKDNDLLLAMPIPVRYVVLSRLVSVYLLGLMYSAFAFLPGWIVYLIFGGGIAGFFGGLFLLLEISVINLILSCLLGYAVARISLKLKNRSVVAVLISLVFIGLYYLVYFRAMDVISALLTNAVECAEKIKTSVYVLYLFGSCGCGDPLSVLLSIVLSAAALCLVWKLLSHSFLKVATTTAAAPKSKEKANAEKQSSLSFALLRRELLRFVSSANYMLNCGFGVVFLLVGSVVLAIRGRAILTDILTQTGAVSMASVIVGFGLCFLSTMNNSAAPSVSLEGKGIWLAQSLPVDPWQFLRAKIEVQLLLTAPPMLCVNLATIVFLPLPPVDKIMAVLLSQSFVFLNALFDMFVGIRFPNLEWSSELVPIKQSTAVFFAIFAGWLYIPLTAFAFFLPFIQIPASIYMMLAALLNLGLCCLLIRYLKTKGAQTFAAL